MIELNGHLRCRTEAEAELVRLYLPKHIEMTRAEEGCLVFEVTPEEDGLTWRVHERFVDQAAFDAHQMRAATTDWARKTGEIPREYTVDEIDQND